MKAQHRTVADAFASIAAEDKSELSLKDGSRVAVVGGGPASSFFSFFLLKMADSIGLEIDVDIFEPRSFSRCGPAGCNHCGGVVSESMVQILAAEGINLPPQVVQRGIESYVVHMDVGSVDIRAMSGEQRIATLYRGNGPREGGEAPRESFDGFLQGMAIEQGANVVRKLITGVEWRDGFPWLKTVGEPDVRYDLVTVASGSTATSSECCRDCRISSNHPRRRAPMSVNFVPPNRKLHESSVMACMCFC